MKIKKETKTYIIYYCGICDGSGLIGKDPILFCTTCNGKGTIKINKK